MYQGFARVMSRDRPLTAPNPGHSRSSKKPRAIEFAVVVAPGHKARGRRTVDLLIAAVPLSAELPLYARNGADFRALETLIDVVVVL